MFQPQNTSIKRDVAFVLAVAAAGFKIADSRFITTEDGAAWRTTLVYGRTKIVTVSNGGYGGPDVSHFHASTPATKAADKASLAILYAVPEVVAAIRGHMLDELDLDRQHNNVSTLDYVAAQNEIQTQSPAPTEANVEFLVSRLADVTGKVNSFKRAIKTKLVIVFEGGDAKGEYTTYKLADTPANRERVKAQEKNLRIDYFVADLFSATNELAVA